MHDLIEISRFDAGTAQLVTDDTDVAAAVAACLRTRGWSDVVTDFPAGLTMPLDRRRFDVIIADVSATRCATVTRRSPCRPASSPPMAESSWPCWSVTTARASPPHALPHVFERFYKADAARARSEDSGLGLAIAWENARLHGGHIEAGNHPGGGAVFTVACP